MNDNDWAEQTEREVAAAEDRGYQQVANAVRRLHYVTGAWCFACNRAGAVTHIDSDRDQPSRLCTHGFDNECAADELPWPCPTERALEVLAKADTIRESRITTPPAHRYTSTACHHGRHTDCATGGTRWDGTVKTPAQCKYCTAKCECRECDHKVP